MGSPSPRHRTFPTPPTTPRSGSARALGNALLLGVLGLIAAVAWWWSHPPDPVSDLRERHRPLILLERVPEPALGRGIERWRMIAEGPDTVTALWRLPPGTRPVWAVVLLGGIGTDDRSVLLVPDSLPIGVLAVSWPWKGPRQMESHEFVARIPAIRAALLGTPGAIARGVEAVRRAFPGTRVALIGASLGVPPTVAALPLAHPEAIVVVDGAADLERLLRSEVARQLGRGAPANALAPVAGSLGARLLSSLEPSEFGTAAGGTPMLLVDAAKEERYPRECVEQLHASFPHAARSLHPGGHIRPEDRAQVTAVIDASAWWLAKLDSGAAPGQRRK